MAKNAPARARYELRRRATRKGLDPDAIEKYADEHDGRCEICTRIPSEDERGLHIDHSHSTGVFRGLVCNNCNGGLGRFMDNTEYLKAAIKYLTKGLPA